MPNFLCSIQKYTKELYLKKFFLCHYVIHYTVNIVIMLKTISSIPMWLSWSLTITFIRFQWNCKYFDAFKNITFIPWSLKSWKPHISAAVPFQTKVLHPFCLTFYVLFRNILRNYIWKSFSYVIMSSIIPQTSNNGIFMVCSQCIESS